MLGTPFPSPGRVKRRRTPPKFPSAVRITSSDTPSSRTTAIAAVALSALWGARIGRGRPLIFGLRPPPPPRRPHPQPPPPPPPARSLHTPPTPRSSPPIL